MKILHALASGMAGAVSLTLLHQLLKKIDPEAPRVDELGMKAIAASLEKFGITPPDKDTLFKSSLAGDLVFNSLYYSLTAAGKLPLVNASVLGLGAGIGAVTLPGPLGLGESYTNRTNRTKLLAMAIYLVGGLAAASTYRLLTAGEDAEILE